MITVRARVPADDPEWLRMRLVLWPEGDAADHQRGMVEWSTDPDHLILVAPRDSGGLRGFAEVGTRKYAEGCESSPVAYLEGWYVDPDSRRTGLGAALVRAAESWARERGLTEFASDALIDNDMSHRAHRALGFSEVERIVCFRKGL